MAYQYRDEVGRWREYLMILMDPQITQRAQKLAERKGADRWVHPGGKPLVDGRSEAQVAA